MAKARGRKPQKGTRPSTALALLAEPENGKSLIPPSKNKTRFQSGKAKLGLTPFSDKGPISSLCQYIVGGKKTFMELARLAPQIEPILQPLMEDWEGLGYLGQQNINIDSMCKVRGIDPMHFLSVVGEAAMKFRDNACIIVASLNMPNVVMTSIKTAQTKEGVRDRELLFKHSNFIPTPSGTRINVLNQAKAESTAEAGNSGMRSFERSMIEIDEATDEEK